MAFVSGAVFLIDKESEPRKEAINIATNEELEARLERIENSLFEREGNNNLEEGIQIQIDPSVILGSYSKHFGSDAFIRATESLANCDTGEAQTDRVSKDRFSICGENCGRDREGTFHCRCGKCKKLPNNRQDRGYSGDNRCDSGNRRNY